MDASQIQRDFDPVIVDDYPLIPVSYTHLRAHETGRNLVCRLLLEKKKKKTNETSRNLITMTNKPHYDRYTTVNKTQQHDQHKT